jgi:dihydroflavonol-4-reductase
LVLTERPVLVTGASGFIGSHIVRELLEHGYRVRGTARSPARLVEQGHLTALPGAAERLDLMAADLNEPGSFDKAVSGCEYVIHTASPYVVVVDDPKRDLLDPAVDGTVAVLAAARDAGQVRRVVVTSSFAAVTDEPDGVFDEEVWNNASSLERNPYYYSKVMAERAAWDFAAHEPGLDVISINPTLVIGPSLVPSLNESNKVLADLTLGRYPGILSLAYGIVDVRDVATAHRLALENPLASGRYLCTAGVWTMRQVVECARAAHLRLRRLPSLSLDNSIGTALVNLAARFQPPGARSYLLTHLGRLPEIDTTKIRNELGMTFRPIEETVVEGYRDLLRWGHVTA